MLKSTVFIFTFVSVFLAVSVESLIFILQLKGQKFTKWFGKNAFGIHMFITSLFWILSFSLIVLLQFEKLPLFHHSAALKYTGLVLLVFGLALAVWGFMLLGIKRSFGLNFFSGDVPIVKNSLYKFIKNPEDYGFWMAFIGFALFTRSSSNLVVAIEFIILQIPHMLIENIPIKRPLSFRK
jgi:protein-S-isoprenylcysteine O-methyltransferase Ste14